MNKVGSGGNPVSFIFGVPTTLVGKIDGPWVVIHANMFSPKRARVHTHTHTHTHTCCKVPARPITAPRDGPDRVE